ncbi:MAG: bifunctional phosphoserine phosphatase/homoserine phosphotransferase ThrH [Spirochaetae bacterium HGW-Spirochaetae-6]|jgi:phosphoserine/homoserine phosphotransferase|nr:MAG: bifunctional phosphoserine phosphatase/homoserine phosphotransferase ThrH [Spirochaetae bacterium HGW-Spirochaetae-6]
MQPTIMALDLEGVLIPEIWIAFSKKTGIEKLKLTTRDISNYDELMQMRLGILQEHDLKLADIQEVIGTLDPMPGAKEFLDWLRTQVQVVILSDTFYEFAKPLMAKLGFPTLFCHSLEADAEGYISSYNIRIPDPKKKAVESFKALNFRVYAAGDSYNDTTMLGAAHQGILFKAPAKVAEEFPHFPLFHEYHDLKEYLIKEWD